MYLFIYITKEPLDAQGCGIDRNQYISSDDYLQEIEDFDESNGKPLKYRSYKINY